MMAEFEMSDLGRMHFFLGLEVGQSKDGIFISQKKYVQELLERFEMQNSNSVCTPAEVGLTLSKDPGGNKVDSRLYKQIVGCLMYLTAPIPDIMYAVSLVSRYMGDPTDLHLHAAKRILWYLRGTSDFGLLYKKGVKSDLIGFIDNDYGRDLNDRKSTSDYVFMLGSGAISWSSKKQPIISLFTTEAEYTAAVSCAYQIIWLRGMLGEINFPQDGSTLIYYDNMIYYDNSSTIKLSTIKLSKNPVNHERSKHIDVRYHFLWDHVKDGTVHLDCCRSEAQVADIFAKPLKLEPFQKLRALLGVCSGHLASPTK